MSCESTTVPAAVSLLNVSEEYATVVAVNDGKVFGKRDESEDLPLIIIIQSCGEWECG